MKKHAAPIIAAILLLLPVLYVGSYLALVVPGGIRRPMTLNNGRLVFLDTGKNYRLADSFSRRCFWPLERIDRQLRPGAWKFGLEKQATEFLMIEQRNELLLLDSEAKSHNRSGILRESSK